MILRLDLLARRLVAPRHVVLDARPGSCWADAAELLGWEDEAYVGPDRLAPSAHLGRRPLLDGALISAQPTDPPVEPAYVVLVTEGPGAGRVVPLTSRTLTVGRAPSCDLVIDDPGVSARHLQLELRDAVFVTDLESTNGIRLDGQPVVARALWLPGVELSLGSCRLVLQEGVQPKLPLVEDGAGGLLVPAGALPCALPVEVRHTSPRPPATRELNGFPWLAAVLPLVMAAVMAWVLHSPSMLWFGLFSPVMAVGASVSDRRRHARDVRRDRRVHDIATRRHERVVGSACEAELARRRDVTPDPARLCRAATTRGPGLWAARVGDPGWLLLRVGTGPVQSRVLVDEIASVLPAAPVWLDLSRARSMAVVGAADCALRALSAIALQLAVRHRPGELSLAVAPGLFGGVEVTPQPSARHTAWVGAIRDVPQPLDGDIALVWTESGSDLPWRPGAVLHVDGHGGQLHTGDGTQTVDWVDQLPVAELAEVLATLRPLRVEAAEQATLPSTCTLIDVLDGDPRSPSAVRRSWDAGPTTTVTLGIGPTGPFQVNLAEEGPHALVGGTTGAGKSELLQTLVLGLAMANRPEDLCFVLVDFKGGAAFADVAPLPHTVGMVTDLDEHLAERALVSLKAELARRERLLAAHGARDLDALAETHPGTLPRLVLVVDEFRMLAEQHPAFLDGLVRVAAVGRSLGVHLILATQRPGGIVSGDIKANVSLRVALRMRDASDAQDVVESDRPALFSPETPGRALVRGASGEEVEVQTAYAGGRTPRRLRGVRVLGAAGEGPRDIDSMVQAICQAAQQLGTQPPPSPWLDPLPEQVLWSAGQLGLVDVPHEQAQRKLTWDSSAPLGVMGGPRSGKTTTLRTIGFEAGRAGREVYVLSSGGELEDLEGQAWCAAFVTTEHPACARAVLAELARQGSEGSVLVVDDVPTWVAVLEDDEALVDVLRDGARRGVSVVLSGDRSLATGRLGAHLSSRWVLRMADRSDLAVLGIEAASIPVIQPPGRAITLPGGLEAQVAVVPPSSLPANAATSPRVGPLPLDVPDVIRVDGMIALGAAGYCGANAVLELRPGEPLLVAGPARSGRTSALRLIASQWEGPVLWLAAGRQPEDPVGDVLDASTMGALHEQLHTPGALVVVDDIHRLADPRLEDLLLTLISDQARAGTGALVAAGDRATLEGAFRPLATLLRRSGHGLVLMPTRPGDGEVLELRLPPVDGVRPGRGVLVQDGRMTAVQLARRVASCGVPAEVSAGQRTCLEHDSRAVPVPTPNLSP